MQFYSIIYILLTASAFQVSCDCGKVLIPGDDAAEFPWMVKIVDILPNNELAYSVTCAGSLISPSVVVTSARCFYNETSSSKIDANKRAVYADDPTEEDNHHRQISHIRTIHLARGYKGREGFYAKDIAWLILENPFNITSHVGTVCIDFNNVYEREDLHSEKVDTIRHRFFLLPPVGGSTIVPRDECISTLPEESRSFITADKFCARAPFPYGLVDTYRGMAFNSYRDGRWYIRGVFSDEFFGLGVFPPLAVINIGRFIDEMEENVEIKKCGKPTLPVNPLIVRGNTAEPGGFPWHVAIYQKNSTGYYDQICGGSLISLNVVISAAHCFYDDNIKQPIAANHYAVAAGKNKRPYNWLERFVQKSPVDTIHISIRYHGIDGLYAGDIAWLILKTPFYLSAFVTPICLDSKSQDVLERLQDRQVGKVAGWGLTADDIPSHELQEMSASVVSYDECISTLAQDAKAYVTLDKFCAGHVNGTMLCNGDSGGGLAFQRNGRWYLRGIVSVNPVSSMTCNTNSYTAFTEVRRYTDDLYRFTNITLYELI